MRVKLHIIVSDEQSNILTTLQHTGVHYPTSTIVHEVEIEIPDPPRGFEIASITLKEESK